MVKIKNDFYDLKIDKISYLLKYFNFLLKVLIKYEFLQSNWIQKKLNNNQLVELKTKYLKEFVEIIKLIY